MWWDDWRPNSANHDRLPEAPTACPIPARGNALGNRPPHPTRAESPAHHAHDRSKTGPAASCPRWARPFRAWRMIGPRFLGRCLRLAWTGPLALILPRNPNAEVQNPNRVRRPKTEVRRRCAVIGPKKQFGSALGFRLSDFGLGSAFVVRTSEFGITALSQEEFRMFLKKHGIENAETYVCD